VRESIGLQQEMERSREAAAKRVEDLEQAKKDAEALKTITAKDIRRWEEDDARVSPTALDAIIEVLNKHKALTGDEIAQLRERAERLNELVEKGHKPQKDKFSSLLKDLMDDREIGRPQLATALASAASPEKLDGALTDARQQAEIVSQPLAAKNYSITARRKSTSQELQVINLNPGSITAEHVHLIEAGALPSPDLYDLLMKGLEETKLLETHEVKDFDRNYTKLRESATQTNTVTVTETVSATPSPDEVKGTPAAVDDGITTTEIPVIADATPVAPPSLVASLGLAPKEKHTDRKQPALDPADALTRYATIYMEIFTRRNLVPPPSEDGNERNKARTELADHIMGVVGSVHMEKDEVRIARNKLVRQLRPLAFEPISDDVLAQVRFDYEREEFERLNAAMADVGDHIFHHSRDGVDTQEALKEAHRWLREHGVTSEAQIRELNNGRSLSEMITPNEFKKNVDIPKQMERFADRLRQRYPKIAEEGEKSPMELVTFGHKAEALQDYYSRTYQRFDSILDRLQSEQVKGRYAAASD
jgi:hypothetical protein